MISYNASGLNTSSLDRYIFCFIYYDNKQDLKAKFIYPTLTILLINNLIAIYSRLVT